MVGLIRPQKATLRVLNWCLSHMMRMGSRQTPKASINVRSGAFIGFCENTPKLRGNKSIAKDAPRRMAPITSNSVSC